MASVTWVADQVRAHAPDAASFIAARRLAQAGGWAETGVGGEPPSVWGLCQGTGRVPYQVCIDVTDADAPGFRCSCPSSKSPCKHALALLLRWVSGQVEQADPPEWVSEWNQGRAARATRTVRSAKGPRTDAQEKAARRRAAAREQRMAAGIVELREWLRDQVRHGIAGMDKAGYRHFEPLAARLVDAQVPGLASAVRRLSFIPTSGQGWEDRMLAELSLLHLLTGEGEVPAGLAAVSRTRIGQSISSERILATPPVRDVWQVIGMRDSYEDRLAVRRIWLIGRDSGREALVLSFAAPGQTLAADLFVGTALDADLCFYPGVRALVANRYGMTHLDPVGSSVSESLRHLTNALAQDPWLESWPMLLRAAIVPGERWFVLDTAGDALPVEAKNGDQWRFLAASGGAEAVIAAEWTWSGLIPLAMFIDGGVVLP